VEELRRGVEAARRVALYHNLLARRRAGPPSGAPAARALLLLALRGLGGAAPLSDVARRAGLDNDTAYAELRAMEAEGLVRVFDAGTRAYAALTEGGRRAAEALASLLAR